MELGKNWGKVDPMQVQAFNDLGLREQSAVRMALSGIHQWQLTRQEPKPMRVRVTQNSPFDLRSFVSVLHELRIGVTDSLVQEEDGIITFQPRPYSKTFMPENDRDRVAALRETIDEQLSYLPKELRDLMGI